MVRQKVDIRPRWRRRLNVFIRGPGRVLGFSWRLLLITAALTGIFAVPALLIYVVVHFVMKFW